MGEAKRKKQRRQRVAWPEADNYRGIIDLHMLPPVAAINGACIRELTGDSSIPDDGRRNYAHEFPEDIVRWVGGDKIAIVQVDGPVGVNRRSSLELTHWLAKDFDGVIHWARDTATYQSILKSFIRLDLDSVAPPELPDGWKPEITILAANGARNDGAERD